MTPIGSSTWADVEALRTRVMSSTAPTVEDAAQSFARALAETFSSVVLARLFVVAPLGRLPAEDQAFASRLVNGDQRLRRDTPTLTLLGTFGKEQSWCDRKSSRGHRAIPLLDGAFTADIPMVARLLSDLQVDFAGLSDAGSVSIRRLAGGRGGAFYVEDAGTACDASGRKIISATSFVASYAVRTVFGMGGAYEDGTLAVAIVFTKEQLDRLVADRFASLIGNFKMRTSPALREGRICHAAGPASVG